MSLKDARKTAIMDELLAKRFSNEQAARLLGLSVRQVQRLKSEAAVHGVAGLLHKGRGRKPPNSLDPEVAARIVGIYREELANYNFCHTADVLAEEKGILVSVSTVARYLKADGIRSPKARRRPKKHRSRKARSCEGELAQMDASTFDWLGDGSYLHLHGAVDDATGRVLALHFEKEETFEGYSELMVQMNRSGHLPREIYTDGRTVFVCDSRTKKKLTLAEELDGRIERPTQFARALRTLGILLIIAGSPQAKGGIERLWETLQDRLPKDMRRMGITGMDEANAFLAKYLPCFNRKFAVPAASPQKVYLPSQPQEALLLTFAIHETRKLDMGLAFSFYGQMYRLPAFVGHTRVLASPLDTLTVATSSRIGIKVIYKGLALVPEPLRIPRKAVYTRVVTERSPAASPQLISAVKPPPSASHPWRRYPVVFDPTLLRSDIFPDESTP